MSKFRYILLLCALLLPLALQSPIAIAGNSVDLPLELEGTLHGAAYRISVPENWNGTLLVFAHGYSFGPVTEPVPAAFGDDSYETLLLDHGYALAASGFRGAGWTVAEGMKDTRRLVAFFRKTIAKPDRTILYGASMGTVVTLKSMEKYPGYYDGAISLCSVGAGATANWDIKLAQSLAYDVTFGWPAEWGEVGDVKEDIDIDNEVMPKVIPEFFNPANKGLFEFIRLVTDLPLGGYYESAGPLPAPAGLINTMLFTGGRAQLESIAGGPVAQNRDHVYSLSDAEKADLAGLGVDVEGLLAAMNARTNIRAYPPARAYLKRYANFTGEIHGPIVMVHNIEDPMLPVEHTSAYMETLKDKGNEDLLVRVYTDLVGHCNFTADQLLTSIIALEGWLDTGTAPGDSDFPGFVHGYEPGPFPQPPAE